MAQQGLDQLLAPGAKLERVATGFRFTEGPAWDGKQYLYFSDIPANIIYRMDEQGNFEPWLTPSEKSNGLMFDSKGNLIACRHWGRDVVRISPDKKVATVAGSFEGKKFNSPNDCCVARDGTIYFTDPDYGLERRERELDVLGVYRVTPDGKITRIISDMTKPNGLFLSPDERTLYVADTVDKKIRAYTLTEDGRAIGGRDFFVFQTDRRGGPDGMTLDERGNIYCTDGGGVWVISPQGKLLGIIETPEVPANCTFGGADNKTLYITARTSIYRIRLNVRGLR